MEIARRGRAALTVCSTAFVAMGRAQAVKLGFAGLPIGVVPHPFGLRTRAEVTTMAEKLVQDIATLAGSDATK
ncbi:MAG: hypothetical protein JSR18_11030 [Proteobacteria bacterium]|nr:hypothetical protein [Pseudomonadota bacterium]